MSFTDKLRHFDWGARADRPAVERDRVATVPNALSALRLLGLPVFVWQAVQGRLGVALAVLVLIAATDWVDGYVARRFDQVSRLGKMLDPMVDRALLVTAAVTLWALDLLPTVVLVGVVARDVLLLGAALVLFRGIPPIPVSRTGKLATALLLVGVPAFLLAGMDWPGQGPAAVLAWSASVAGIVCYWVAGLGYARVVRSGGAGWPST